MKLLGILVCAALGISALDGKSLSSADREALLDKLDDLQETVDSKVDARFRVALAAYRGAMKNGASAMEFYLKCVEKVDYEDLDRKHTEFREWKRNNSELLSDQGFRLALRYQLQWLILTLQASSEKADPKEIAMEVRDVVGSVFGDIEKLKGPGQVLEQSVLGTVFARAYEIDSVQNESWSDSPMQLEAVYDQIILPHLRRADHVDSLRAMWMKRIQQEGARIEAWNELEKGKGKRRNGRGRGGRSRGNQGESPSGFAPAASYEEFMVVQAPELKWRMELDAYRSGDERGAAMKMLAHIRKHLTHRSARKWGEEFRNLLAPPPESPGATSPVNS